MKKILVGMSGGVDSSVAALLLCRQGYEVGGLTLELCAEEQHRDPSSVADAARVCKKLGIPHYQADFSALFRSEVVEPFAEEYLLGRTPNPCVLCNRAIKFGAMLQKAFELGYDGIATGHYAQIVQAPSGEWQLKKAPVGKDQSYVLYSLTQAQLAHILFPLNHLEKEAVRALAEQYELPVAHKPDSQEICFVPDGDYAAFVERYTGKTTPPGDFVDAENRVLGQHRGLLHYTVGQRKGLGVTFGKPMYVTHLDAAHNRITLGEEGSQYASELTATAVNWISGNAPQSPFSAQAKVRYQAQQEAAILTPRSDGSVFVRFEKPQRSVTPGQTVVFYDGDTVLGGGTIL